MKPSVRKIVVGSVFFLSTCGAAIVGYYLAGWSLLDAIYMVTITIFGVGYGEVRPLDQPVIKVFTMGVIIFGCSSLIYVTGGFIQMVTEGEINRAMGVRRRTKGIDRLRGHAIVCGFGRVGRILAQELSKARQSFVVVDTSPQRIAEAEGEGYLAVTGNATEEETLRSAGIDRARVLATVLPDDAANVFITLTARDLHPTIEIIGRAESLSTEKKLLRSGATRVVMPSAIGAVKICDLITNPSAGDLLQGADQRFQEGLHHVGLRLREIELPDGSPCAGRKLTGIRVEGSARYIIVGLKRREGDLLRNPDSETVLQKGDTVFLLTPEKDTPTLAPRATAEGSVVYRGQRY